ncbi:MAG: hypothetical protein H7Y09_15335 [Chitinophagaceae bacterium]|nr:hypothetical protein [Anaerolineae bacterium]
MGEKRDCSITDSEAGIFLTPTFSSESEPESPSACGRSFLALTQRPSGQPAQGILVFDCSALNVMVGLLDL